MNLMFFFFFENGVMIGTFFMIISMILYTFVLLNLTPLSVWVRLLLCNDGVQNTLGNYLESSMNCCL